MRQQNRQVCLTLDNFSRHKIAYEPKNIILEFFKPNLTPFVQPLDVGIIRCFKAHYHHTFCLHVIELDEAGERGINKLDLREGMVMACDAWNAVQLQTIVNCWNHTKIQQ
jgi:DDE superfamily endonuclease